MRLGLGLGIVKSAASIYKGILDKFPNAVAAYSTRKLKTSYPTTLPADYGGGAAAAYSLRKVKSDYEGSAVKVRRSSDDALQDIGFDSNGDLDTTALTTFVNADITQYNYSTATQMVADFSSVKGTISVDTIGGEEALKFTIDTQSGTHFPYRFNVFGGGGECSISFDYYLPSTNTDIDGIQMSDSSRDLGATQTIQDTWTSVTITDTLAGESIYIFSKKGTSKSFTGNGTDAFYIKNLVVTQTTADGHVTRWYSQSDPVDTYTSDFTTEDGFTGTTNNTASALTSVTDDYGTTVDNVLQLNCDNTTSDEHILRKNNPLPTTGSIANLTLKCSFKMLVPSSNTTLVGAALSDGTQTTAGIVSDGKVTEQGRWITFTDVAWTQVNQSRLFIMGLDASDNVTFSATEDDKFYIADVVLTQTTDAYNGTGSQQPLVVSGGSVVTENGKAAIEFDGVDDLLRSNTVFGTNTSIFSVFKNNDTQGVIYSGTNPSSDFLYAFRINTGGIASGLTVSSTYKNASLQSLSNQTSVYNAINTANQVLWSSFLTSVTISRYSNLQIGNSVLGGTSFNWSEIVLFDSDQSTNRKDIEWNINNHYSIYEQWDRESCMNVRRSSDNATQDIGFSGKNINQTQLESFVNDASPVLDDYTGDDAAEAAYSLRKVRTAYTGSAINVRRSSDGDTKEIGFDANGDLDTTALENFCRTEYTIVDEDFSSSTDWVLGTGTSITDGVLRANTTSFVLSYKPYVDTGAQQVRVTFTISNYGGGTVTYRNFGGGATGTTRSANGTYTETLNITEGGNANHGFQFESSFVGDIDDFEIVQLTADGHVTTWYDQSGNDNRATADCSNPSACEQPLIVEAGDVVLDNGKPAIKFDGVDDYFDTNLGTLTESSVFMLFRKTGNGSTTVFGGTGNRSLGYTRENLRHRVFYVNWGAENITDLRTPPFTELVSFFRSETAATLDLFRDGANKASLTSLLNTLVNPTNLIGQLGGANSYYFEGLMQELIFFDSADQSTNRQSIEGNIGRYYNITGYRDGFVTKWYDQSGEYNHAENSTSDEQPQIVSNGSMLEENGKAAIQFDGSDMLVASGFSGSSIQDSYFVMNYQDDSNAMWMHDLYTNNPNRYAPYVRDGESSSPTQGYGTPSYYVNGSAVTITTRTEAYNEFSNSKGQILRVDEGANTSTWQDISFGLWYTSYGYNGNVQEIIIFNSDQSSSRTDIEKNINTHFKIYN